MSKTVEPVYLRKSLSWLSLASFSSSQYSLACFPSHENVPGCWNNGPTNAKLGPSGPHIPPSTHACIYAFPSCTPGVFAEIGGHGNFVKIKWSKPRLVDRSSLPLVVDPHCLRPLPHTHSSLRLGTFVRIPWACFPPSSKSPPPRLGQRYEDTLIGYHTLLGERTRYAY